jgi:hypothetical protein
MAQNADLFVLLPEQSKIFKLPGLSVDTKITVFEREFHVHSLILKLGSGYFRAFLDSPDKSPATSSGAFRYEYGTVVDADGMGWGLEAVSKVSPLGSLIAVEFLIAVDVKGSAVACGLWGPHRCGQHDLTSFRLIFQAKY